MRRWILFACLILISAIGALVPAAAQAVTVVPGCQLTSGQTATVPISKPGNQARCDFTAPPNYGTASSLAAAHVTFQVSSFDFTPGGSTINLEFTEPDGAQYCPAGMPVYAGRCAEPFTGVGPPFYAFNPPVGGVWSVVAVPEGAATGSMKVTFAVNKANTELSPTIAAGATISIAGQYADYTFDATEGQQVTFHASTFSFYNSGSGGTVNLVLYDPDGTLYTPPTGTCSFNGDYSCAAITMPAGGQWFAFLEPQGASVGSLTLTMS
jgi:hypothetical protein